MWALVEDNTIVKIINRPKGMVINDIRYSRKIFELWSKEELNNVGLYSVVFDNTNKQDGDYYNNTDYSFNYADGQVTASYGIATPKKLSDTNAVNPEDNSPILENGKQLIHKGLKTLKKEEIKKQASYLLEQTDWYNHKALDDDTFTIPEKIKTYRANIRAKSNEMETAIDNASDIDALRDLYIYTDGERPLGEFPILEE